jgi:hypothetical protein
MTQQLVNGLGALTIKVTATSSIHRGSHRSSVAGFILSAACWTCLTLQDDNNCTENSVLNNGLFPPPAQC